VDVKTEERRGRRTQWSKHYAHVRWLDKWGDATDGFTQDLFGDPAFESPEAARAAWPMCRRAVWGNHHRFRVPSAAELFDGIIPRAQRRLPTT
jgi:hypothetical protein